MHAAHPYTFTHENLNLKMKMIYLSDIKDKKICSNGQYIHVFFAPYEQSSAMLAVKGRLVSSSSEPAVPWRSTQTCFSFLSSPAVIK